MPATSNLKASDKQTIIKKLVTELKKRYGGKTPKQDLSVLDTLLFAACLEDSPQEQAEASYGLLLESFFDLNEIRVSSVTEIQHALGELAEADWKAMRIRETLQHTFEKYYAYDLEGLKRKTQDAAVKDLAEIPFQTPFMQTYTIQHALGGHVAAVDDSVRKVLIWMGLASHDATVEQCADELKSGFKKADGVLVCHLLKCLSVDEQLQWAFEQDIDVDSPPDPHEAAKRLAALIKNPKPPRAKPTKKKSKKPSTSTKSVTKKKPTKKVTTSRSQAGKKKTAKKVTKKKPTKKKS